MTVPAGTDAPFNYSPYIPYDPTVNGVYNGYISTPATDGVQPLEFTGWRDEMMSWHDNCYLHAGLNPTYLYRIKGPEALKMLSDNFVNTFKNFPVGKGKHGIMVNSAGLITAHGMLLHVADDEYLGFYLHNRPEIALAAGNYNAKGEDLTGRFFNYQIGGPRSLEVIEAAAREDLHDLPFIHFRNAEIAGVPVRILRIGMAGSLAYEVHGATEHALAVYSVLLDAGHRFDIRRLGRHAYWNTHTENGFPQYSIHFPAAPADDIDGKPARPLELDSYFRFTGSMGSDKALRYVNPVEVGWGGMINFDHEFVGKAALQEIKANPSRKMVTLEWNAEDILDIHRSELHDGEPYAAMDGPEDFSFHAGAEYLADKVLVDGRLVGVSTGRIHSWFYRKMLSLCSIDVDIAEGANVTVVWGDPGTRQKHIRAVVARYPYFNGDRNEKINVADIPKLQSAR